MKVITAVLIVLSVNDLTQPEQGYTYCAVLKLSVFAQITIGNSTFYQMGSVRVYSTFLVIV